MSPRPGPGDGAEPEVITSTRNLRVSSAARLHRSRERSERGLSLLEGPHLLAAAVDAGAGVLEVFGREDDLDARQLAERARAEWVPLGPAALGRLAGTENPRGPVAVVEIPPPADPVTDLLWVGVADPGNAGTLIRTAAAFGLDVVLADGAVDPWEPKVLRAAAGAHFQLRLGRGEVPEDWGRLATIPRGGTPLHRLADLLDPGRRWAVLVGSEAHGLDPARIDEADVAVTIPMPGDAESLNAALAGAIVAQRLTEWRMASDGGDAPR